MLLIYTYTGKSSCVDYVLARERMGSFRLIDRPWHNLDPDG